MSGAALMLAHQIAAKAARDGLFLSRFPVTDLPKIVTAAAVVSLIAGWYFAGLITRRAPANLMPAALMASATLHVAEFVILPTYRAPTVVFVYLHIVGFGAILLSGFWSVVSEGFDPREAKLRFGRIAGAGTFGGIAGGLLAERCTAMFAVPSLLLLLAVLHTCAAVVLSLIRSTLKRSHPLTPPEPEAPLLGTAVEAFRRTPFLYNLALLVLLGTMSAALLDFIFKAGATEIYGRGVRLTRFFALFYTGGQLITFLIQTFLTPPVLQNLGLGRAVMMLPGAVAAGAGAALYIPVFPMVAGVRMLELTLRGSFFRSGYEIFFTPIPPRQKRAVKTIIDVGCDRFGDALGAIALQLLLMHGTDAPTQILLFTVAIGALAVWIASRMDRAYLNVLEQGLTDRAIELQQSDILDKTTRSAVMGSVTVSRPISAPSSPKPSPANAPQRAVQGPDVVLSRLADLRSGNLTRVREALKASPVSETIVVPQVIRLLAWNEATEPAREFLSAAGSRVIGQLTDVLLDQEQEFAVRRRIPRILARNNSQRAVDGLLAALGDPRFEIRFQVSRALDYMRQSEPDLDFNEKVLLSTLERELAVPRGIWDTRKLLDTRDAMDSQYSFLDELVQERANQPIEYVFSLLAVLYPRDTVQLAFRALHSDDRMLHGLALEYLEGVLPTALFEQLSALLDRKGITPSGRSKDEVLDALMASQETLAVQFKKPSGDALSPAETQPRTTSS